MIKKIPLFIFWIFLANNSFSQITFSLDTIFLKDTYCRRLSLSPDNNCWSIINKDSSVVYEITAADQIIDRTTGVKSVTAAKYSDIVALANNVSMIATPTDYVIKYDAGAYSKLGAATGLQTNNINSLERVGKNIIYITERKPGVALGTNKGLYMTYDNLTFSKYPFMSQDSLTIVHFTNYISLNSNVRSRAPLCPNTGDIAFVDIALTSHGIIGIAHSSFNEYTEQDSVNTFVDIVLNYDYGLPMRSGRHIWGTKNGLRHGMFECYPRTTFKFLEGISVNKIYEMRYFPFDQYLNNPYQISKLLIGTDSGLYYDPMNWVYTANYNAPPDSLYFIEATKGYKINDIEVDQCNSQVWLATDKGIVRLKINNPLSIVRKMSLEHPNENKPICASRPVILSVHQSSVYSYQWQKDNVNITGGTSNDYATGEAGNYRAVYTYSDGCRTYKDTSTTLILELDTQLCKPSVFADTAQICQGETFVINTDCSYQSNTYQWYRNGIAVTNATQNSFSANTQGYYKIKISNCNISKFSDSIFVSMQDLLKPSISAVPGKTACLGDTIQLSVAAGEYDILWYRNAAVIDSVKNKGQYRVRSAATYTVKYQKNNCSILSDPLQVTFNPISKVKIVPDKKLPLCKGDELKLRAENNSLNYHWSSGETSKVIRTKNAGKYKVLSFDTNNCKSEDSIDVKIVPIPIFTIGKDTSLCEASKKSLHIDIMNGFNAYYVDGTSIPTNSFDAYVAGTYIVSVSDKNTCINSDTLLIFNSCPDVVIPNLFTPNMDDKNEVFYIKGLLPESTLRIYNRWGNLVYINKNYDNDWDGESLSDGVYYYDLQNSYYSQIWKGWVQIMR